MTIDASMLSLTVDGVDHLREVTATFQPGRLHTVIGRTLAGKTTLLRVLAGLQDVDSGSLTKDGTDFLKVPVWRRDTAMVYQQFINYPHLNVLDNVSFPLKRAGHSAAEVKRRAMESLTRVGMSDLQRRKPSQLSGGQQQRLALARALARGAGVLLLDEPFGSLDYKLREQLREEFKGLFSDQGDSVVIYTTTEPAEAMLLGDVVTVMHEGRVVQTGAPHQVYDRPESTTVARIINDPPMNVFAGIVSGHRIVVKGLQESNIPHHLGGLPDGRYQFGLRATDVALASGGVESEVTFVEISGSETFVHVSVGDAPFVILVEGIHDVRLGDYVQLRVRPERLFAFTQAGALLRCPDHDQSPQIGR